MKRRDQFRRLPFVALLGILAGCQTLAERWTPESNPPQAPDSYLQSSEGDPAAGVQQPSPGEWWKVFRDPELDSLVDLVRDQNPDARAALERVEQSYAALGITESGRFPTIRGDAIAKMNRDSLNNLLFPIDAPEFERYRLGANATWEVDLWGRVKNSVKRDRLRYGAEVANSEDVILSVQASLARQYLEFRNAESELAILNDAIGVRREDLDIQKARLELGAGIESDVSRSEVELETARASAEAASRRIGKLEHSIAILTGVGPSELKGLTRRGGRRQSYLPNIPAGVPSTLLERRPDLRAAKRTLLAAAAQIGVRKVEFLPKINLTGTGGVASLSPGNLFGADSTFFDLGPQIDIPIYQSGAKRSAVRQAEAQWREAAALYHGAMLQAVREVEDALLDLKSIERELEIQKRAVTAASKTVELARLRHERGLVSYFEVVDAERTRLQSRRTENALEGELRAATVRLIQALGGKW